ncbi:MAG: prepilin-type N-terminal cleavage/methylation domain-containing protein [Planctomycetes bacterium]|jgi:prepilin-type N-terminal cleavage/methylation domain-containing protein/prepilin-type processing-associated H-X9-DG protein|nr:prepilin-type N-terminal cleavage/methylation domain-containing protein [Planctomycetota bacterium]
MTPTTTTRHVSDASGRRAVEPAAPATSLRAARRTADHCVQPPRRTAFTLIELLVVIAIIALLVSILLPSLNAAKELAKAVKCQTNMSHVGRAMAMYNTGYRGNLPTSYLYAAGNAGNWELDDQRLGAGHPHGYIHWSWFLYEGGEMKDDGFQCPSMKRGGHPATNCEDDEKMPGQTIDNPGVVDKQASRMAYATNGAVVPRNKLHRVAGAARANQFVMVDDIEAASKTLLVTEYQDGWKAITNGSSLVSKSHRPITPFVFGNTGVSGAENDVFYKAANLDAFVPNSNDDVTEEWGDAEGDVGAIAKGKPLNAIGRHHPGGSSTYGGTTNFGYVDGHVERKHLFDTLVQREWGDRFYGITGANDVHYEQSQYDFDDPR